MRRYLGLLRVQLKAALLLALQYRLEFFMEVFMALLWSGTALVPLYVLFSMRDGVRGWTAEEMLVVVGFFTMLKGVLASVIQPSLSQAVEHIRKGTLDFLLLKPADAQFLLSTSKLELAHLADVLAGVAIIAWALAHLPGRVSLFGFVLASLLLACALAILYAIWILVVSLAFRVVKIDNMNYLIVSLFEAARWPSSIFRGALALVFTFVIPLALLTTYPALALLGKADLSHLATAVGVALFLLAVSRVVWTRSIRAYAGASS
ncbi:MAG TPA: ABC-2 family transporter protein [Polyangiales bacterium]|jgi:ABC-2 type transport system permease protein|nr:ABC-2 family transporter protein [Polyangiales bacterium]